MTIAAPSNGQNEYRYRDKPPLLLATSVVIQSAIVAIMNVALFLVIFRTLNMSFAETVSALQYILIAFVISLSIQCFKFHKLGSGLFIPSVSPAIYLAPGLYAASVGGLGLMAGMMICACLIELALSTIIRKLRATFPKEVCGLAFLIVGIEMGMVAFRNGLSSPTLAGVLYILMILVIIILFSVWFRGVWRNLGSLYAAAIGICVFSFAPNMFGGYTHALHLHSAIPFFGLPGRPLFLATPIVLSWGLMPVFLFTAFTATIRVIGVAMMANTYERQDGRPDYSLYRKAIRSDAISGLISSLFTGIALNVSPVTATLSIGAKCTSRYVPIGVIIIYLCLAFSPRLLSYATQMPNLLICGVLIWYSILLSTSGLKIMEPNHFQTREIYSVGLPLLLAVTIWVYPNIYAHVPKNMHIIIANALVPAMILAILLTLIFHIKNFKTLRHPFRTEHFDRNQFIDNLLKTTDERISKKYAKDIADSVRYGVVQINRHLKAESPLMISITSTKSNLIVSLEYDGQPTYLTKFDTERIYSVVEEEAITLGLTEYYRLAPNEVKSKSDENRNVYKLIYYLH